MLHIKVDRCLGTATEFPLWYEICGYTKTFLSYIYSFIHLLPIYVAVDSWVCLALEKPGIDLFILISYKYAARS